MALAEIVGHDGRVYAVDSDPRARDEVAAAAAAYSQVLAITQAGEDLLLPEPVDLAFCRFLLLHVVDPAVVLRRMRQAVRPGGWVVAQEPITSAGRVGGVALSMPDARHPDVGALLPALVRDAGLDIVDAWAEAPAGVGPGPVADLPGLADRGRPRRRPGRAAAAGDRARARARARRGRPMTSGSCAGTPTPDLEAAARGGRAGVVGGVRCRRAGWRRPAVPTPTRSWPTTSPTPPPGVRAAEAALAYGANGDDEARIACAFVADALADLAARTVGREEAFGTTPDWLDAARRLRGRPTGTRAYLAVARAASRATATSTPTSSWCGRRSTASPRSRSAPAPSTSTAPTPTSPRRSSPAWPRWARSGLSIPEEYGGFATGGESDYMGMVVATEELSWGSLGAGGSLITRPEILTRALVAGGTEEQKQTWLPKLASGEVMNAVAVTEPDFGSDVAGIVTAGHAHRRAAGWSTG